MLRQVMLYEVTGRLYLTNMPGYRDNLGECLDQMTQEQISVLVSLTGEGEIRDKSPDYAAFLEAGQDFPWKERWSFPIRDYSIPEDKVGYLELARQIADQLRSGVNTAIHCAGGIGRTGTLAALVLVQLGFTLDEALYRVRATGSDPESPSQENLLKELAAAGTRKK